MRKLPAREGFTLIELLITMVIIAVLATIAVGLFWSAKDRGLLATMQSDLKSVASQQEQYFAKNQTYASDPAALTDWAPSPGVVLTIGYAAADGWAGQTTHPSLAGATCGLMTGAAPAGSAEPATTPGIVSCTGN